MVSFSKTFTFVLSLLIDLIERKESIDSFCLKVKRYEDIHPRFFHILNACKNVNSKDSKYCTCGEDDCDCTF